MSGKTRFRLLRLFALSAIAALGFATAIGSGGGGGGEDDTTQRVPVLNVTSGAELTQADADRLAQALGLGSEWPWELIDGNITYIDRERVLALPVIDGGAGPDDVDGATTIRKLDIAALAALTVLPDDEAIARAEDSLRNAGLAPQGRLPVASHTRFELLDTNQNSLLAPTDIDTVVSYTFSLNGIPVEGPGARIVLSFDADGNVALVHYAWREVTSGEEVELLPQSAIMSAVAARLETTLDPAGLPAGFTIDDMELVYYAPPLTIAAEKLYPHYRVQASRDTGDGEEVLQVRDFYVPAFSQPLRAGIFSGRLDIGDGEITPLLQVHAEAIVQGGRPPYDYWWISSSRYLDHATYNDAVIDYEPIPGGRTMNETTETLSLVVRDADGQRATAEVTFDYGEMGGLVQLPPPSGNSYAAVWMGVCGGLAGSDQNARGFIDTMRDKGETYAFLFHDDNAWEWDFKDKRYVSTGSDDRFADNVDILFYTGHASSVDFYFCDDSHDDQRLRYNEAHWGDNELEWLIIAACGPLYDHNWNNWEGAFDGLHLLMGYGSRSSDNTVEGETFATWSHPQSMFGGTFQLQAFSVPVSWMMAAYAGQPSGKIWAIMGVNSEDCGSSVNDHLWGQGTVSPDLRPNSPCPIDGFWRLSGQT